ncbi:hypothetical protein GF325_11215, partial [Candidatus Bathyarchaeota archaeon]|nr:hypothetical protein [Candidatus Bathyarchaeota archaeon]
MNEHDDGSSENSPGNEERDEIGEKRELISLMLEKEKHEELLQLAFTIINERNKKLLNDAVDAVRQVITTHPALVNKSQVQLLVDFLHEEDDILRANAVLALKPIAIHDADHVRDILMQLLELDKSPVCKEEAIRLLAHIGTKFPGKIRELIPILARNLEIDSERVAKQSLKALRVISKEYPSQVEKILRKALETVEESSMLEAIDELLSDIIKRRELKTFDEKKQGRDDEEEEIIPDIPKKGDHVHEELPSDP